jgi:O-antigen ligase
MSSRALSPPRPRIIEPQSLGAIGVAGAIAGLVGLASQTLPLPTIAVGLGTILLAVLIRMAPLEATMLTAVVRAAAEGLNDQTVFKALGFSLSPADAINIGFLLGALWWLLANMRKGLQIKEVPLATSLLAFFLVIGVSLAYSPGPISGFKDAIKLGSAVIATLLIVATAPRAKHLKGILVAFIASSLLPMVVAIWQFAHGTGQAFSGHGGLRIQSVFDHPNHFGTYLVVVLTAVVGLWGQVQGAARRVVETIGAIAFVFMILSLSRSAWMMAGIIILVLGWRRWKLLGAGAAVGGAVLLFMPRVLQRLTDVVDTGGVANSADIRLEIWSFALPLWEQHPILGQGWGAFNSLANGLYAHNDYLRVLIETGLIGLIVFLVVLWKLVQQSVRVARGRKDFPRAFLGLALSFIVLTMITNNLEKLAFQWYFWALAGVAFAWPRAFPLSGKTEEAKL